MRHRASFKTWMKPGHGPQTFSMKISIKLYFQSGKFAVVFWLGHKKSVSCKSVAFKMTFFKMCIFKWVKIKYIYTSLLSFNPNHQFWLWQINRQRLDYLLSSWKYPCQPAGVFLWKPGTFHFYVEMVTLLIQRHKPWRTFKACLHPSLNQRPVWGDLRGIFLSEKQNLSRYSKKLTNNVKLYFFCNSLKDEQQVKVTITRYLELIKVFVLSTICGWTQINAIWLLRWVK